MKNKYCLLIIIAIIAMVVALDYTEVKAYAEGEGRINDEWIRIRGICKGCGQNFDVQQTGTGLDLYRKTTPSPWGSWVYAHGQGWEPWDVSCADFLHINWRDWGMGKDEEMLPEFLETYDSIRATVVPDPIDPDLFHLTISGFLSINYGCPNMRSYFTVEIRGETGRIVYKRSYLQGSRVAPYYLVDGDVPYSVQQVPNPCTSRDCYTKVIYNYSTTFTYDGDWNALKIILKKPDYANYSPSLPTLSGVGLIVLVVALVGTGVALFWWRRKRAFAAV